MCFHAAVADLVQPGRLPRLIQKQAEVLAIVIVDGTATRRRIEEEGSGAAKNRLSPLTGWLSSRWVKGSLRPVPQELAGTGCARTPNETLRSDAAGPLSAGQLDLGRPVGVPANRIARPGSPRTTPSIRRTRTRRRPDRLPPAVPCTPSRTPAPAGGYLRDDHRAPFHDEAANDQLLVKNVVLLHVPFRDAGWVGDANGGARSLWYDLLGAARPGSTRRAA